MITLDKHDIDQMVLFAEMRKAKVINSPVSLKCLSTEQAQKILSTKMKLASVEEISDEINRIALGPHYLDCDREYEEERGNGRI